MKGWLGLLPVSVLSAFALAATRGSEPDSHPALAFGTD